jgi:sulfate transport system ATP-binding protein
MSVEISQINKVLGKNKVLDNVSLSVPTGELLALLGPSGCGKTTLLRIIAGLETPDSGRIFFFDQEKTEENVRDRDVGFVFQHYALFKHMTVFENVAFGLKVKRINRPKHKIIADKVNSLLELIQLEQAGKKYPSQLSGGERQRVALARAPAVEPRILLLDEPFGALDAKVRKDLRKWIRELHDKIQITSVFVTHDQEEALEVADSIVIMDNGIIQQAGNPMDVYDNPANPFVYNFLGNVNLFNARKVNGRIKIFNVDISNKTEDYKNPGDITGYVRPHDILIFRSKEKENLVECMVYHVHGVGALIKVDLRSSEFRQSIEAELSREEYSKLKLRRGDKVYIDIKNLKIFNTPEK